MARQIHLQPHLRVDALARRYRATKEPNERSWWQILWLLSQGHTAVAVATVTGYSAYWIGQIAKRYNVEGPAGMSNRRHTTSHRTPPAVSPALQEELRQAVAEAAARNESWTGAQAAAWIGERLATASPPTWAGATWCASSTACKPPVRGSSDHTRADPAEQDAFKKS